MARIDQQTVERILEAADIVDVVGDYVDLRRRGANYMGLCPFHNERTPSFSVSRTRGICKCFSCGKGGNVVNFLMAIEQIGYGEALRRLARRYGIEIKEEELTPDEIRRRRERDSLFAALDYASRFFVAALNENREALDRWRDRGLTPQVVADYSLGVVPADRDALQTALTRDGFNRSPFEAAGILDASGHLCYPGAPVLPIANFYGKVVAFRFVGAGAGGADVDCGPERLFRPDELLIGLDVARRAVSRSRSLIIAADYADMLALASAGVEGVVAPVGATLALGEGVLAMVKRMADGATLVLPAPLYWRAYEMMRAALPLCEKGMRVWVADMSGAGGAARFALGHSSMETAAAVDDDHRSDMLLFKLARLRAVPDGEVNRQVVDYLTNDLLASLAAVADPISREVYVEQFAPELNMRPERLMKMIEESRRRP